ncbi:MAG: hypothetical protein CVT60_06895, partial [Actinobacteria bacterium HGW-Actinobacteria-10]
ASGLRTDIALQFDLGFFVSVVAFSIVGCAMALRRSVRLERYFWTFLLTINVLTFISQAWYSWYLGAVDTAGPPIPSFTDYVNLLAMIAFVALVAGMIGVNRWDMTALVRHTVDVAALASMGFVLIVLFYVDPLLAVDGAAHDWVVAWSIALYPLSGIAILGATFSTIVGWKSRRWLPWERFIALSLAIYGVGLLLSPPFRTLSDYSTFNYWAVGYSLMFLLGHYFMLMAALYRLTSSDTWALRPTPAFRRSAHSWLSIALPVLFLGMGGLSWMVATDVSNPSDVRFLAWFSAGAMTLGLSIRGIALVLENGRLHERSITDELTKLLDRRQFFISLADEVESAQRYGDPVGLAVLNIDGFGVVNNRLGARVADAVLLDIATAIARAAGPDNMAFRMGGDEFAVIIPGKTATEVREIVHRIRGAILLVDTRCELRLTASLGFAVFPEDALDHVELARRADAAQYYAKTHGRDQIVRFDAARDFDFGPKERAERLINESHLSTVRALAAAVDARDAATQFHSRNVARLSVQLAEHLGFDRKRVEMLETAAVLHDIGKIGVSDHVLRKRGSLTPAERREVNNHAALGERILAGTSLHEVLPWILSHHERWDGTGYPTGLTGEEIPYEARILAVCDAFDAMTSDRPYRSALSCAAALQEIDLNMGTQFDPVIAEVFIRMVGRGQQATNEGLIASAELQQQA